MTERTTVRLPEDLLNSAKRKAAAEGRILTSLIEDGLRLIVTESEKDTKRERVQPRISTATGGPPSNGAANGSPSIVICARFPGLKWQVPAAHWARDHPEIRRVLG
jgi:hypothetical protein